MDLGEVEVDPDLVKVAQEYQVVYHVELDDHGKPRTPPERVPQQYNIYDSIPGMERYSPIWQFNYVVVPATTRPTASAPSETAWTAATGSRVFEN